MLFKNKTILISLIFVGISCGPSKKDKSDEVNSRRKGNAFCLNELQAICDQNQLEINQAQLKVEDLIKTRDEQDLASAQLNLNELLEIQAAYQQGQSEVEDIRSRYVAMRTILASHKGDPNAMSSLIYHADERAATQEVFAAFGELTIDPQLVAAQATENSPNRVLNAISTSMPWAGYWYPKRKNELFSPRNAPLIKLDRYLAQKKLPSAIAAWELEHYDKESAEWEGLCDSWAMASISVLEPKSAKFIDGIEFSVSDLKAIAIKYYEGYKPLKFGRRYRGMAASDGQMQDLRPEAFHRIVEEYLGKRQQPIIVDQDPGPEVWSKPLFRIAFTMSQDPNRAYSIRVKAYPWMTRERAKIDESLTSKVNDLEAPVYEYRLYYDPQRTPAGQIKIVAGEWIGPSLDAHPDMVLLPQKLKNQDQLNPEIKIQNEEIRNLLGKAGMLRPLPN